MKPLDSNSFRRATLADATRLNEFLSLQQFPFCDYSFVNLFIWGHIFDVRWSIADGRLWIYSFERQRMFFPLGPPLLPAEMAAVADAWTQTGEKADFVFVPQEYIDAYPQVRDFFACDPEPGNADYLYLTEKLVELKGNKLAKKKNLVSQFIRIHPQYRVFPFLPEDAAAALDLAERWCKIRSCDQVGFRHETSALKKALEFFASLGLEGVKVMVDGRMTAFALFSRLSGRTADVHFEKFDPELKGVGQIVNWETARVCLGRYDYLNREQDMGIPGLRQAKKSYDPARILMSYFLRRV